MVAVATSVAIPKFITDITFSLLVRNVARPLHSYAQHWKTPPVPQTTSETWQASEVIRMALGLTGSYVREHEVSVYYRILDPYV